jgi:hypothetical protein
MRRRRQQEPAVEEIAIPSEPGPPPEKELKKVLAKWLGLDVEQITGFVAAVEYDKGSDGFSLSSLWSSDTPRWRLLSFAQELKKHLS